MCADLNDMHNNYDVDTQTELSMLIEVRTMVRVFNETQNIWNCELKPTKKGWCLHYE